MDPYLAQILIFAGNFAPRSWMFCNGSLQNIADNTALFSLLGTTYGGDGQVTFALPDLRGRIPVGTGQGPGLSNIALGEMGGSETVTLLQSNLPAHQHSMAAKVSTSSSNADGSNSPTKALANTSTNLYAPPSASTGTTLGGANVTLAAQGGNQPISILKPYQAINYIIAVEGIYPSRN